MARRSAWYKILYNAAPAICNAERSKQSGKPDQRIDARMDLTTCKYIAVEGPIGVGKTTLTKRLAATLGARPVLELPTENPFLEKFYRDAARYALPTQMHFLFQRMEQLQPLNRDERGEARFVADFVLEKDALFAQLTLADEELKLYQQLYAHLRPQVRQPDLLIYLQASPSTLLQRIAQRGIAMEGAISADYLQRLCDSYSNFFYHYDGAPLLTVNTEHLNLAEGDSDFSTLLSHIAALRGKRAYLNQGD